MGALPAEQQLTGWAQCYLPLRTGTRQRMGWSGVGLPTPGTQWMATSTTSTAAWRALWAVTGQCHTQNKQHYMDNFRALKRKKQPKPKTQPRTKASGAKRHTEYVSSPPDGCPHCQGKQGHSLARFSVPEAAASFAEVDHLLSSAELPGEIQSLAKQGW